jgi:hypothetical protein
VLRIDWPQPAERAALARQRAGDRHDEVAAGDEGLLVGGCHDFAGAQCGEHRSKADDPAGGDDNQVDVVARREVFEEGRIVHGEARHVRPVTCLLLAQERFVAAGGESDDPEPVA